LDFTPDFTPFPDFTPSFTPSLSPGPSAESEGLIAEFFPQAVQNNHRSGIEGRPIFETHPFVRILIPGDKHSIVERKATDTDKQRFARQWQAFQSGQAPVESGTPIEQWPILTVSQVAEFKAMHIRTVEHLAGLSDGNIAKLGPGGRSLVEKAKAFIAQAKDMAEGQRLAGENEHLRNEIATLKEQVAQLAARLEAQEEVKPAPKRKAA
jgi:hypothetical protein